MYLSVAGIYRSLGYGKSSSSSSSVFPGYSLLVFCSLFVPSMTWRGIKTNPHAMFNPAPPATLLPPTSVVSEPEPWHGMTPAGANAIAKPNNT